MVQPEGNNWWTRNAYGENKILPDQFNNEYDSLNKPGVQAAIRNIMHSRETAQLLISGTSASFNCTPSGSYSYAGIAPGWILTRDSDSLSRIVAIAQATGLNIDAVTKCIVASNDGTASVKAKTSVLPTDVILAIRSQADTLVDIRNLKTEDDILSPRLDTPVLGGVFDASAGLLQPYRVGVNDAGYRTIILKNGDSISEAITALGGNGTIILLPGAYTGSVSTPNTISIIGNCDAGSIITGDITLSGANSSIRNVSVVGTVTLAGNGCWMASCSITGTVVSSGDNVTISSSMVTYPGSGSLIGIHVSAGSYTRISNCHVSGGFNEGARITTSLCVVNGNTFTGMRGTSGVSYVGGIRLVGSNVSVCGNIIKDIYAEYTNFGTGCSTGMYIEGSYNVISGNVIYDAGGDATNCTLAAGIYSYSSSKSTISSNVIRDIVGLRSGMQSYGIMTAGGAFTIYVGNTITNVTDVESTSYGINTANSTDSIVVANVVNGIEIPLSNATSDTVANNEV